MVNVKEWTKRGKKGWEADIRLTLPDGTRLRERVKSPVSSKSGTIRWAQQREAELLARGGRAEKVEKAPAPTLAQFWPDFMEGYVKANREKHSSVRTRECIYREHFARWYDAPLDSITDEEVQKLKASLADKAPKTVNNVLVCLSAVLKAAVEWKRLDKLPCRIRLVKVDTRRKPDAYDDEQYEQLVAAAKNIGPDEQLVVLLGGDAGLRRGEMIGLEWRDIDLQLGTITLQRAEYRGQVGTPKGGKTRVIPMTARLREAVKAYRHLRGPRVLYRADGTTFSEETVRGALIRVEKRAGLIVAKGKCHKLRHTFCSRLAMSNVPLLTIQMLAGHESIETTQRYMHLSHAAPAEAIRCLDARVRRGDVGETEVVAEGKAKENAT
jgi:integrase